MQDYNIYKTLYAGKYKQDNIQDNTYRTAYSVQYIQDNTYN